MGAPATSATSKKTAVLVCVDVVRYDHLEFSELAGDAGVVWAGTDAGNRPAKPRWRQIVTESAMNLPGLPATMRLDFGIDASHCDACEEARKSPSAGHRSDDLKTTASLTQDYGVELPGHLEHSPVIRNGPGDPGDPKNRTCLAGTESVSSVARWRRRETSWKPFMNNSDRA